MVKLYQDIAITKNYNKISLECVLTFYQILAIRISTL